VYCLRSTAHAARVALALIVAAAPAGAALGQESAPPPPPASGQHGAGAPSQPGPSSPTVGGASLSDFRTTLDHLDAVLLRLLAERFRTTKRIDDYRRRNGPAARDEAGEKLQLQKIRELAAPLGLDPEVVQRIFRTVVDAAAPERDARSTAGSRRSGAKADASEWSDLRASLENLDTALLRLLAERFRTTEKVGEFKRRQGLPARDEAREAAQLQRARTLAASVGLDPELAQRLYRIIFDAVVANHQRVREPSRGGRPGSP